MSKAADRLRALLGVLDSRHRRRELMPATGLDFASNDYLGFAGSSFLNAAAKSALDRGVPLGAGGSRLLRGNHDEHVALEAEAADFFGSEAALFVGGGFQANQAIFSTLPGADDLILYDALIHASTHEGMRLGKAETQVFVHNDPSDARRRAREWRDRGGAGQIWIAVESVYSMEGDIAPLQDLAALARETDAILVVDEAHATGVLGPDGRGLAHDLDAQILTLHTCGKGLGVSGGLVCGPRVMIETLINKARTFIFATAPSPLTAASVRAAIVEMNQNPQHQEQALARISHARAEAARTGIDLTNGSTPIIPIMIGDDGRAMALAAEMQAMGFDVRGIRPPTVPRGTARLRVSITGNVSHSDITALFDALSTQLRAAA